MKPGYVWLPVLLAAAACSATGNPVPPPAAAAPTAPAGYDFGAPYIGGPLPQGETLVPAPPQAGSSEEAGDQARNRSALALTGSARWQLAAQDADLGSGWYGKAFSCAAGIAISPQATPAIANLLRRVGSDFGMSTGGVKSLYQRARPFTVNGQPSCTPEDEAGLRKNGSYPSGHSAIGYGTSLVLASILPERATQLVARGRAYGESRAICNVHWESDVEEGRVIAAATFARLQSVSDYERDVTAARKEVQALAGTATPLAGCDAEKSVLEGS